MPNNGKDWKKVGDGGIDLPKPAETPKHAPNQKPISRNFPIQKKINEKQIRNMIREALDELNLSTYRNAYYKMPTSRQDAFRQRYGKQTVFNGNKYSVTSDFETLELLAKENNIWHRYDYERDAWINENPPKYSPNDTEYQQAINAVVNQIAQVRQQEKLGQSQWANANVYYDTQYDAKQQAQANYNKFYGAHDNDGATSFGNQDLFNGTKVKITQEVYNWGSAGLNVKVLGEFNQWMSHTYDYTKDDWTGMGEGDGSSNPPKFPYDKEGMQAAQIISRQIAKYRQMQGINQPSQWQNKNIYFS